MQIQEKIYKIPKYLVLSQIGKISTICYFENLDEMMNNISEDVIYTVYIRNGSVGKWWEYFCDISKGVTNA